MISSPHSSQKNDRIDQPIEQTAEEQQKKSSTARSAPSGKKRKAQDKKDNSDWRFLGVLSFCLLRIDGQESAGKFSLVK